jgi:hypothetical protein
MAKKQIDIELNVKTNKATKNLKDVDDGLKGVGSAGQVAGKGFKVMGTAMKAAGIGLIVTLFAKLVEQLQKNQKFMDAMNEIFLALEPILMQVAEGLATVVEGIAELMGSAMKAAGATGNLTDGLVQQRKEIQLLEAELGLLQLQYQQEAELMRQIRDDESQSIDDRINANYELGKVLAEQLEVERGIAEQALALAERELALNSTNVELQVALTNAKLKLAEIDERITGQRSEQLVNLNSLEREREAQQQEASRKREEQLRKEAELMDNLIALQNEDIKAQEKSIRTLSEQLENAKKANEEILGTLDERMVKELKALENSKNAANANIAKQRELLDTYEADNAAIEENNKKRAESTSAMIEMEMDKFVQSSGMSRKAIQDILDMGGSGYQLGALETVEELQEFEKIYLTSIGNVLTAQDEAKIVDKFTKMMDSVNQKTQAQGEEQMAITEEQSQFAEDSLNKSLSTLNSYEEKKLAIQEKYGALSEEQIQKLIETEETLQAQADQVLFEHFETEKEREIRLAEEKYDILLGFAEGNAEATLQLEKEKANAIKEINQREQRELAKNFLQKIQDKKKEIAMEKELERQAGHESLQMAVGLAKEGTAVYKAMASAETIMATYMGATKAMAQVPFPFNFVQAGLVIATGIKNLAEINKAGGNTDNETMPDTITDDTTGDMTGDVPAITFGDAGSEAPPVQAYVVETDISNAQALQSELDLQSTL